MGEEHPGLRLVHGAPHFVSRVPLGAILDVADERISRGPWLGGCGRARIQALAYARRCDHPGGHCADATLPKASAGADRRAPCTQDPRLQGRDDDEVIEHLVYPTRHRTGDPTNTGDHGPDEAVPPGQQCAANVGSPGGVQPADGRRSVVKDIPAGTAAPIAGRRCAGHG